MKRRTPMMQIGWTDTHYDTVQVEPSAPSTDQHSRSSSQQPASTKPHLHHLQAAGSVGAAVVGALLDLAAQQALHQQLEGGQRRQALRGGMYVRRRVLV